MNRTEQYESPEVTVFELSMSDSVLLSSVRGRVRIDGQDYEIIDDFTDWD